MVILCMFDAPSAKPLTYTCILVQNIFSTQDHAAAAYVDNSPTICLTLIHLKQYRCNRRSRFRVEGRD
jgi:hypothetical protein